MAPEGPSTLRECLIFETEWWDGGPPQTPSCDDLYCDLDRWRECSLLAEADILLSFQGRVDEPTNVRMMRLPGAPHLLRPSLNFAGVGGRVICGQHVSHPDLAEVRGRREPAEPVFETFSQFCDVTPREIT